MSVEMEEPDDFERYCADSNFTSVEEIAQAFATYMQDTAGWDGNTFSLTEDELTWIRRANDVMTWLQTYQLTGNQKFLDAALRSLEGTRIPGSLNAQIQ